VPCSCVKRRRWLAVGMFQFASAPWSEYSKGLMISRLVPAGFSLNGLLSRSRSPHLKRRDVLFQMISAAPETCGSQSSTIRGSIKCERCSLVSIRFVRARINWLRM